MIRQGYIFCKKEKGRSHTYSSLEDSYASLFLFIWFDLLSLEALFEALLVFLELDL